MEAVNRFSVSRDSFGPGDYVSPSFSAVNVDACFPAKMLGDMASISNPLFRKHIAHAWYVCSDFPECGFITRDEAHILYQAALNTAKASASATTPLKALEIGSHVGWSTVHIALGLGDVQLDVVEPQLTSDPRVLLALIDSLRRAGLDKKVNLLAGFSPQKVEELANGPQKKRWSFIFIDGNHNGDYPLNDAIACKKYAADDCIIFFHDLAFPDVAKGFLYFKDKDGWSMRIYHTQQIMGAVWRGNIIPPTHIPDSTYDWQLPDFLAPLFNADGSPV